MIVLSRNFGLNGLVDMLEPGNKWKFVVSPLSKRRLFY